MQKTNTRTLSLRYKLLIALMTLTTVFFFAGYFGMRIFLKQAINGIMRDDLDLLIKTYAECLIEDELEDLQAQPFQFANPETWTKEMTDARYWEQQKCLDNESINDQLEVFTYFSINGSLRYGLDQFATIAPDVSYPFGSEIKPEENDDYDKLQAGLDEFTYYEELVYFEESGAYYSGASAPLYNSKGEKVGGITLYLDAGRITTQLNSASNFLAVSFLGAYALVALLALAVTRNTTAQLSELAKAAKRIAAGNYSPIKLKPQAIGDEVSALAELFNTMTAKIQGREEDLKHQVEELEIVIDLEQKEKDIKEIKDSAYFQDVKARAAEIRKTRQAEKEQGDKSAK